MQNAKKFNNHYDYRSLVGKLMYLEKISHPDITYSIHKCARYSSDPSENHSNEVKHI